MISTKVPRTEQVDTPYHPQPFEPRYRAAGLVGWILLGAMLGLVVLVLWHHGF
jgi:hypothetical protein